LRFSTGLKKLNAEELSAKYETVAH